MATSFDVVEDYGLTLIEDYKLAKVYNRSETEFRAVCDGFLVAAIPLFIPDALQSLDYDITNRQFLGDLTNIEVAILGRFWMMCWWERYVNISSQFQGKIQANSFKNFSEPQNLKEKRNTVDGVREKTYQLITNYQLQDIDTLY